MPKVVLRKENYPFNCTSCLAKFQSSDKFCKHVCPNAALPDGNIYSSAVKIRCELCSLSFNESRAWDDHVNNPHHMDRVRQKQHSALMATVTPSNASVKKIPETHSIQQSSEMSTRKTPEVPDDQHYCGECEQKFFDAESLALHSQSLKHKETIAKKLNTECSGFVENNVRLTQTSNYGCPTTLANTPLSTTSPMADKTPISAEEYATECAAGVETPTHQSSPRCLPIPAQGQPSSSIVTASPNVNKSSNLTEVGFKATGNAMYLKTTFNPECNKYGARSQRPNECTTNICLPTTNGNPPTGSNFETLTIKNSNNAITEKSPNQCDKCDSIFKTPRAYFSHECFQLPK